MLILFKACPRCRGDVDASHSEDVYCVQCGNRPEVAYPGPRILEGDRVDVEARVAMTVGDRPNKSGPRLDGCPRCGTGNAIQLEKVKPDYHTCYRCRRCGHVYSP